MNDQANKPRDNKNPAISAQAAREERRKARKRIPMSTPRAKMWVPDLPGYFCYWFNDTGGRLEQALAASFEFVNKEEVDINPGGVANDVSNNSGSDLGSRISMVVGTSETGGPLRAYLMKLPLEYREDDVAEQQDQRDEIMAAIAKGRLGVDKEEGGDGMQNRYVRQFKTRTSMGRQRSSE
jgi:hypothetical protein